MLSLSENGCLLRSPEPLMLGSRIALGFELPRSGKLELDAETAYQLVPDMGVVFNATSPSVREAIGSASSLRRWPFSDGVPARACRLGRLARGESRMTESDRRGFDLFAPTPEHALLADTLREFVAREVEPQAAAHDRDETFNLALFRRAGELGLLGVTLPEEYGGAGLDAIAAVQVCEALSTSDPGFALAGARARDAVRAELRT